MLYEGDDLAGHPVYELDGTLDYIELAHKSCAPEGWDQPVREGSYPVEDDEDEPLQAEEA
jgi:hypothetical protein